MSIVEVCYIAELFCLLHDHVARVLEETLVVKSLEVHECPILKNVLLEYVAFDEDKSVISFGKGEKILSYFFMIVLNEMSNALFFATA